MLMCSPLFQTIQASCLSNLYELAPHIIMKRKRSDVILTLPPCLPYAHFSSVLHLFMICGQFKKIPHMSPEGVISEHMDICGLKL